MHTHTESPLYIHVSTRTAEGQSPPQPQITCDCIFQASFDILGLKAQPGIQDVCTLWVPGSWDTPLSKGSGFMKVLAWTFLTYSGISPVLGHFTFSAPGKQSKRCPSLLKTNTPQLIGLFCVCIQDCGFLFRVTNHITGVVKRDCPLVLQLTLWGRLLFFFSFWLLCLSFSDVGLAVTNSSHPLLLVQYYFSWASNIRNPSEFCF